MSTWTQLESRNFYNTRYTTPMAQTQTQRVVILDAGTVDYGDIPLTRFGKFGVLKIYDHTPDSKIISRCRNASIVITNKCLFDRQKLSCLPRLRLLCVTATGLNNVDLKAAKELKIAVSNAAGYSTESVVLYTFAFITALASRAVEHHQAVQKGEWTKSRFFVLPDYPFQEIAEKTLGIIGYGTIGRRVAEIGKVFGMKILIAAIPGREYPGRQKRTALPDFLKRADFISIHAPLTPLTWNLLGEKELKLMKKSAFVVNMARGGIIDEKALSAALRKKWIRGAACDVLTEEPPSSRHPLLRTPNLLLSPHVAWASRESRERLIRETIKNIEAFLKNKKRNRVEQ